MLLSKTALLTSMLALAGGGVLAAPTLADVVTWTGAAGDLKWSTPGNWSTLAAPTASDDVVIDTPGPAIFFDSLGPGTFAISRSAHSLVSRRSMVVANGVIAVIASTADFAPGATLELRQGAISGGRWRIPAGLRSGADYVTRVFPGILANAVIEGDVFIDGILYLEHGYPIAPGTGRMRIQSQASLVADEANLWAEGELVFEGSGCVLGYIHPNPSLHQVERITFGPNFRITGGGGTLNETGNWDNNGVIESNVPGQTIRLVGAAPNETFAWSQIGGTVRAVDGGRVQYERTAIMQGVLEVRRGGVAELLARHVSPNSDIFAGVSGTLIAADGGVIRVTQISEIDQSLNRLGASVTLDGAASVITFLGWTSGVTSTGSIALLNGAHANPVPPNHTFDWQGAISVADSSQLTIASPVVMTNTGAFTVLASGNSINTPSARLISTGAFTRAGTLRVTFPPGFVPTVGSTFPLISASSFTGSFASTLLPAAPVGQRYVLDNSPTQITLRVARTADFNIDGRIDPDDISDYLSAYFTTPGDPSTDFDGNGVVNPDDLSSFIAEYFHI